jgi:thioredoxin-dependent peroxiredoxin
MPKKRTKKKVAKTTKKATKKTKGGMKAKAKTATKPKARAKAKSKAKATAKPKTKSTAKTKAVETINTAAKATTNKLAKAVSATRAALGQIVPNVEVEATGGQKLSLGGLKGRSVVLYFYPKDATPGCTIEGHEFTKLHDEFKRLGAEVYGVSRDSLDSHEKFKADECYSIDLLSDDKGELCALFDVIKQKNMYGRDVQGIERSTFVIDPDGKLVKEWRGVKAEGHAQEVLEFLKSAETQQ